jgi:hypothetical protein
LFFDYSFLREPGKTNPLPVTSQSLGSSCFPYSFLKEEFGDPGHPEGFVPWHFPPSPTKEAGWDSQGWDVVSRKANRNLLPRTLNCNYNSLLLIRNKV